MLSVLFKKFKAKSSCFYTQTHKADRHIQIQGHIHKAAFRQAQIQIHKTEDGRHREFDVENSNMDSLLVLFFSV